ncbi:hypothetical protein N656DRAFT_612500 [Canariomyces notabilis]|uniref:Uncharacterized protein n=1 Tax=Canariomyces notabilis TaxID=2074819 RepID=A0AAN6YT36_9PEZI|nr:hypothetical protein N656DRAFT_612500 [Canariomyces arenarius]
MLGSFSDSKRYSKVGGVEHVDETPDPAWVAKQTHVSKTTWLPWLLHLLALAIYSVVFFVTQLNTKTCSPCFSESLLDAPIVWEGRTFFTNGYINGTDPYSNVNPNVDQVWEDLIERVIIVISEEEKNSLPGGRGTTRAYGTEGGYAASLEMRHQLHCLNWIRKAFYDESEDSRADPQKHVDHCFSYLYQSFLCFADVSVLTMTVVSNETHSKYHPLFNGTKQCRNFDVIKAWEDSRRAEYQDPPYGWSGED